MVGADGNGTGLGSATLGLSSLPMTRLDAVDLGHDHADDALAFGQLGEPHAGAAAAVARDVVGRRGLGRAGIGVGGDDRVAEHRTAADHDPALGVHAGDTARGRGALQADVGDRGAQHLRVVGDEDDVDALGRGERHRDLVVALEREHGLAVAQFGDGVGRETLGEARSG